MSLVKYNAVLGNCSYTCNARYSEVCIFGVFLA